MISPVTLPNRSRIDYPTIDSLSGPEISAQLPVCNSSHLRKIDSFLAGPTHTKSLFFHAPAVSISA